MKYDLFISYSRGDLKQVREIFDMLREKGLSVWMDIDGIESGDAFKSVIAKAIKNSDVFLFFSSKSANSSPWTIKEVDLAVYLKKNIIPIRLDDTEYDDSILFDLVGLDYVDLTDEGKRVESIEKLLDTLLKMFFPPIDDLINDVKQTKDTLSNVKAFEVGYDLTVYVIHKLRGQTTYQDDMEINRKFASLSVDIPQLLEDVDAETMIPKINDCAIELGRLNGKKIENCFCLGSLFVLSVIAKRSNVSEEFGHSYDKGVVEACRQLGFDDDVIKRLTSGDDNEMEDMLDEIKTILSSI